MTAEKYKWEHPYGWLVHYVTGIRDVASLKSIIFLMMSKVDGDAIQDLFQDEMDADGYFDEVKD